MTLATFALVMVVHTMGLARALISIGWPAHRLWPPPPGAPRQTELQQRLVSAATALGVPVVAVLDWGSFVFDHPARFVVATALIGLGLISARAHRQLGTSESLGQAQPGSELTLETDGPYAFSRNPQYAGAIPGYLGVALVANSTLGGISALWMIGALVASVFAEEAWMRERFGAAYEDYCRRVPRFVPNPWRRAGASVRRRPPH